MGALSINLLRMSDGEAVTAVDTDAVGVATTNRARTIAEVAAHDIVIVGCSIDMRPLTLLGVATILPADDIDGCLIENDALINDGAVVNDFVAATVGANIVNLFLKSDGLAV